MSQQAVIPKHFIAAARWVEKNSQHVADRYEGQWIAVLDGQVVAAGPDLGLVEDNAAQRTGRDTKDIYVEFVDGGSIYVSR